MFLKCIVHPIIQLFIVFNSQKRIQIGFSSPHNRNTITNLQDYNLGWETRAESLYARGKLADDGTAFGAGQPINTPSSIKGDLIEYYEEQVALGRVEDVDTFADSVIVTRNMVNRGRVDIKQSPILIGQFYQTDTTVLFEL